MKKFETTLSDQSGCHVTLYHDPDDPLSWIVRKWKRGFLGRRMALSRWFLTRAQAERYAQVLIRECDGTKDVRKN
ncbi:MAG: hypothetical protein KFF77_02405 [Bacteroidetes bacterium]|nr:hypothetical protein [Bacteroidota bacterium]